MATFARGANSSAVWTHNRAVIRKAAPTAKTEPGKVTWWVNPADVLTLRGLPAIGRGVAGEIRGTRPGGELR